MDLTPEKVLELQRYAREPIFLDQTIGDDGDAQLGDFIEDSQAVDAADEVSLTLLQDHLQAVLATLPEREASIVRLRFGLTDGQPRTLDEIGQVHVVTENASGNSNPGQWPSCATPPVHKSCATT